MPSNPPRMTNTELAEIRAYANGADHPMDSDDPGRNVARWLLDENARLNAELADWQGTARFEEARADGLLKAYQQTRAQREELRAELDKVIREAAADKAKLAEIGEGSEEWAIRVFHRPGGSGYYFHDSTGEDPEQDLADVLELLADGRDMAGNPIEHGPVSIVKRTVWSTEWETVEPSEMPRPPAEEAQERPETAGTGSGRGTGVAEAPGTAQASDG